MYSAAEPIMRSHSTASSVVSVPTPHRHHLQSLQGAYFKNIDRLERSAEEMSEKALSRQNSIQSERNGENFNVVRPGMVDRMGSNRSARSGSGTYGRNVAEARWGGYSPNGYITSPVGSVHSGWSQASLSRVGSGTRSSRLAHVEPIQEGRQTYYAPQRMSSSRSRSAYSQSFYSEQEPSRDVSQSSFAQRYDEIAGEIEQSLDHIPPSPPKHTVGVHSNRGLQPLDIPTGTGAITPPDRPRSTDTYREAQIAFQDFDGVHFSPETDELVEVDQHGNEIRRVSARSVSSNLSFDAASLLRTPRAKPPPQGQPPPEEGMVYYPAPVPKMLNLPKRLSKLPAADVQAKRRTQMLAEMPEAVAGAPWLNQKNFNVDDNDETPRKASGHHSRDSSGAVPKAFFNERMSGNMSNMPAQLRAEMFFEHQPVAHDVEVKSESAVATLDSILAASATAPVHAFTDHPYAGDVRKSVYAQEKTAAKRSSARLSSSTIGLNTSPKQQKVKKRRSSSIGALLKRTSSSDELAKTLKKNGSRTSILTSLGLNEDGNKLRKRSSKLSLGDELATERERPQTPADELEESHLRHGLISAAQNATVHEGDKRASRAPTVMSSGYRLDEQEQIEEDFRDEEEREDVEEEEDGEPLFVQPSTLLAELQVRKAQQKSRNKTAATAFPNGMHSTLLELDAVEEINKRKRKNQRIQLAWEDPHQRALQADMDVGDEDVPLGMLFPSKDGVNVRRHGDAKDWDRPIGLIEKRQMEDNEPLSRRRNRLRGGSPRRERVASPDRRVPSGPIEAEAEKEEEDDEGETLAQRMKRMKMKDELDGTIAHVENKEGDRPVSSFSQEVLGQLGVDADDEKEKKDAELKPAPSPQPEEEETLGQRRARLQREREANGLQRNISESAIPGAAGAARPPMVRSSTSLANLLAANPVGQRTASKTHQPTQGTLLHANAQIEAKQKNALMNTNLQSSFHQLEKPLVDSRPQNLGQPNPGGMLAYEHNSRALNGGFAAGTFNNGMGGIQLRSSVSTPMLGIGGANGYYASPTAAAMGYSGSMGYGYPQHQQMFQPQMAYPQMNTLAYNALNGGHPAPMATGFNPYIPQSYNTNGATYASYAQSMAGIGLDDEGLTSSQRTAIDRWRMGIGPQG